LGGTLRPSDVLRSNKLFKLLLVDSVPLRVDILAEYLIKAILPEAARASFLVLVIFEHSSNPPLPARTAILGDIASYRASDMLLLLTGIALIQAI
jgi:hypothetical protein